MTRTKTIKLAVLVLVTAWQLISPGMHARAAGREIDTSFFYERLAPQGQWFKHATYGWVWHPSAVAVGWRPYTIGHWAWTDDFGWLWVSDEDWGWATYHYGQWLYDSNYGWAWVPGTVWGPAWVSWRSGGGYIGWAPLPPDVAVVWDANGGFRFSEVQIDGLIPVTSWIFVSEPAFAEVRLLDHIILPARNVSFVKLTTNITKFDNDRGRIINRGVDLARIEKAAGHALPHVKVREVDSPAETRVRRGAPEERPAYRPNVKPAPANRTPPQPQDRSRATAAAKADLSERQEAERRLLQENHARERSQQVVPAAELQQRHQAEVQAQQQQHAVEQRELTTRGQPATARRR